MKEKARKRVSQVRCKKRPNQRGYECAMLTSDAHLPASITPDILESFVVDNIISDIPVNVHGSQDMMYFRNRDKSNFTATIKESGGNFEILVLED